MVVVAAVADCSIHHILPSQTIANNHFSETNKDLQTTNKGIYIESFSPVQPSRFAITRLSCSQMARHEIDTVTRVVKE